MKRHLQKHFSKMEALKTVAGGVALFLATSPFMWFLSIVIESLL